MADIQTPPVARRRSGDPEPDLTGFVVIHRAMIADARRLAGALAAMAEGAPPPPERIAAVRAYARPYLTEIHHHHENEDEVLWPVIEAAAGQAIDLAPLTDDHRALAPVLARAERALAGLGPGGREALRELADALADLRDLLEEHIADEERQVFPVVRRFVPRESFEWCERRFQEKAGLGHIRFLLPWIARHTAPAEMDHLLRRGGLPFRVLLALFRGRHAALERRVFG
ncbi:hemerythrin domain-containing protein [Bailinhaonella thermotolerans]|nr:hemerythrin domain-containing protein [Bailinhaonella thermotolerans]